MIPKPWEKFSCNPPLAVWAHIDLTWPPPDDASDASVDIIEDKYWTVYQWEDAEGQPYSLGYDKEGDLFRLVKKKVGRIIFYSFVGSYRFSKESLKKHFQEERIAIPSKVQELVFGSGTPKPKERTCKAVLLPQRTEHGVSTSARRAAEKLYPKVLSDFKRTAQAWPLCCGEPMRVVHDYQWEGGDVTTCSKLVCAYRGGV